MLRYCAFRHGASRSPRTTNLTRPRWSSKFLLRPNITLEQHLRARSRSFASRKPQGARKHDYTYPENLNIYKSGGLPPFVHMVTRITGVVFVAVGMLFAGSVPFDATISNYWIPVYLVGGAVLLVSHTLTVGGLVYSVNIFLPSSARRSKDALVNFVHKAPPNTRLQLRIFRFRPWAHVKNLQIRDLKRIPPSPLRLTNLEQQPVREQDVAYVKSHPGRSWLIINLLARFYVARDQVKDRSHVPGVWNVIWEQIPKAGEEPVADSKENKQRAQRPAKPSQKQQYPPEATKKKQPPPPSQRRP